MKSGKNGSKRFFAVGKVIVILQSRLKEDVRTEPFVRSTSETSMKREMALEQQ
jgi:hypothetical protein